MYADVRCADADAFSRANLILGTQFPKDIFTKRSGSNNDTALGLTYPKSLAGLCCLSDMVCWPWIGKQKWKQDKEKAVLLVIPGE